MTFHVPSTLGGGWIVRTPHGMRLEMTEYPSCLNATEKAAFAKACSSTREQIRGFGASPQFGPMKARSPACAMAARPTCKPTPCLDVPALNRLLDNVKNRARGAWALWAMTPEAKAMQLGVACDKISAPKCLRSEDQKLLDYFKKHGWSGPDTEMNGKVWVKRAQTPKIFQTPRCLVQLPQIPKRTLPKPRKLVQLTPALRRPAPPPPQRIAVQRVPSMPVKPPPGKRHCGPMWSPSGRKYCARMSDAAAKSLKQRIEETPGWPPAKCAAILQLDSHGYLDRKNHDVQKMLKACAVVVRAMPAAGRVVARPATAPQAQKSPEAPAPILAPPAYVPTAPTPAPSAPLPSPEAPAPVLAPPAEPEISPEVTTSVVEPEAPAAEMAPEMETSEAAESKPFPWWILAVAAGGGYYLYKKSKKKR